MHKMHMGANQQSSHTHVCVIGIVDAHITWASQLIAFTFVFTGIILRGLQVAQFVRATTHDGLKMQMRASSKLDFVK